MANLIELLRYRNDLQSKLLEFDLTSSIEPKINLLNLVKHSGLYQSTVDQLTNNFNNIMLQNNQIISDINKHIDQVTQDIDQIANSLYNNVEYQQKFSEANIHRFMDIDPAAENHFTGKISGYSDWRYPSLQINPRSRKIVDYMVSSDPLYLISHDAQNTKSTLNEIVLSYPEAYQRRLRTYQINDRNFSILPQGQFGFVLCWDTFNYLSIEKIEIYLLEVFKLLKSGGIFMFSYNNCDIEDSAQWADISSGPGGFSYTTAKNLEQIFKSIGYEIISKNDISIEPAIPYVSWFELQKPGVLSTVKAHQSLARIENK